MISGRDSKNNTRRLRDILEQHVADLLLNILRLVTDGHFRETGKVDKGERQNGGRENAEVDGYRRDARVAASLRLGVANNFGAYLIKVIELLAREVEEFSPFILVRLWVATVCGSLSATNVASE